MSADPLMIETHDLLDDLEQAIVDTVASYDPQADFWLDQELLSSEGDLEQRIEQTLHEAHELTGQDEVLSNYGFDGTGQTVVVIDSGIAYEHYALGSGYGEDYRVVGGWDFTENDSDPYDDGPAGGHGTHVAGIIGADGDGDDSGVATGVDLVALRVFDDAGNGYFSWVEDALQWVHDNKDAFENQITTVNLSLGTSWNSDSVPSWAMLEDEFAQLEADGIFISVSAGNSYTSYNEQGVSYPAASDHVIPVMSVDDSGNLSYFSQRAEYAIAAPGRSITSTVPDYSGSDSDTIDNDWGSMSGTSMAAPYVAGASVLIREAMEFTGLTDIDQWEIYDVMMDTADSFYDSTSDAYYKRLNLEAAIDAIMPADDFGSSIDAAYDLGTVTATSETSTLSMLSGAITTLSDADYFSFTAGATGTATFTTLAATHALVVDWGAWDTSGGSASGWDVESGYAMDVVAGETYTIALSSANGLGYYDLQIDLEQNFTPIDLGAVSVQETRESLSFSGEAWYSFSAGSSGYFTVESMPQSGAAQIAIYDANLNLIDTDDSAGRVDALVNTGDTVYVQVTGESSDLDLRLTNAVSVSGSEVTVMGTSGDDNITFAAGTVWHSITLNEVTYSLDASTFEEFTIDANGGADTATLHGTNVDDTVVVSVDSTSMQSESYEAHLINAATVDVYGNGGYDFAILNDSAGDELLRAYGDRTIMEGTDFFNRVNGFDRVDAFSTEGNDRAEMYDTLEDDNVRAYSDRVVFEGAGYMNRALGFEWVDAYSSGGNDFATLYDTVAKETVRAYADKSIIEGDGFFNRVLGFVRVDIYSTGGGDLASLYDTDEADTMRAYSDRVVMEGNGYLNRVLGFNQVDAYSTTADDIAIMYDTPEDDLYRAYSDRVVMSGDGYLNRALGFERVDGYSTEGDDLAIMYGTTGTDLMRAYADRTIMEGDGFFNRAIGFKQTDSYSGGGDDVGLLYGTSGSDLLRAYSDRIVLEGEGYLNRTFDFYRTIAYGEGGEDTAIFVGTENDEAFTGWSDLARMKSTSFNIDASDFDLIDVRGGGGNDTTIIIGTEDDEQIIASGAELTVIGNDYQFELEEFDDVEVRSEGGDDDADLDAIDFALSLIGTWA